MSVIINGKKQAELLQEKLKKYLIETGFKPKLAVILVGDNPASLIYVNRKQKLALELGIDTELFQFDKGVRQEKIINCIKKLNSRSDVHGILVQLPLPKGIDADMVIQTIDPIKDVDGLTIVNQGRLANGEEGLFPCTPLGCLYLIKQVVPDLVGKHVVIIGRSKLVGRPLIHLMLGENCSVTVLHSKSRDIPTVCQKADILIVATGQALMVDEKYIKDDAVVIDVGITRMPDGKIVGDVCFDKVCDKVSAITPVPGGVGPMTVTMLMMNLVKAYEEQMKKL